MRTAKIISAVGSLLFCATVMTVPVARAQEPIAIAELKREDAVDFEREILPIFRRNCLACHNNTDAESEMVLETPQTIQKGGSTGPTVIPGKGLESLLLQVTSHQTEPVMPPEDNDVGAKPLTSDELGLLKLWIDQGATGEVSEKSAIQWQPLPPGVNPIYAVAISPDGQYAAAGRANQIFLYHLPSGREVDRLTDPGLLESGVYDKPGVAHLDLVQSLRFSPDSTMLASGGYRTAKLWSRPAAEKMTIGTLDGPLSAVAVSPDGKQVAVGQANGRIALLSGIQVTELSGHTGSVTGLRYSTDGAQLVSASEDSSIRYWNTQDGSTLGALTTPAPITSIVLLDKQVATGHADNSIRIWDVATLPEGGGEVKPVAELQGHSGPVTSLASIAGQPTQLASGSRDGSMRIWDLTAKKELRAVQHGGPIEAIDVRPDGTRFVTASSNNSAKLWDAEGKQIAEVKGDFRNRINVEQSELVVAVEKRRIENANADLKEMTDRKTAEEKNAASATEALAKAETELKAKDEAANTAVAAKTAAETELATAKVAMTEAEKSKQTAVTAIAAAEQTVTTATSELDEIKKAMAETEKRLADAQAARALADAEQKKADEAIKAAVAVIGQAEEKVKKATEPATKAVSERDAAKKTFESAERTATRAAAAVKRIVDLIPGVEAAVKVAETSSQEGEQLLAAAKEKDAQSEQPLYCAAFSPNGQHFVTGGDDQKIRVWDAETGVPIESYQGHAARVTAVDFTSSGRLLSVSADGNVAVWDPSPPWILARTIGNVDSPQILVDRVTALDFSPDGSLLATGSGEPSRSGELKIWNVASGTLERQLEDPHSDTIQGLEFSPDGTQIASCGADRFAKIFELGTGEFVRAFEGHTHHVLGVTWRADGRLLATSGADNVIKVWNVKTGDQTRTISGFGKEVTAVRFMAAGDNLVATSGDKSVRIKNSANGGNVRDFGGSADFMYSVAVSANGKLIAAGGQDGVLRIWKEDGKTLVNFGP